MNKDIFWNIIIGVFSAILIGGGAYVMMTGGLIGNIDGTKASLVETTSDEIDEQKVGGVDNTESKSAPVKNEIKQEEINKTFNTIKTMIQDGMTIEVKQEGEGNAIQNGENAVVHYTGMFTNGKVFDSSVSSGQPFVFKLGMGMVIQGWEKGVLGMKKGEKRVLTIPPELGYGAAGAGGVIPPNATLIFEVELVDIKK